MGSKISTPQPLYNTIVGVQANFRVSDPIHVISRVKCIDYIGPEDHWSCVAHLSAEDILKSANTEKKKIKNIESE